MRNFMRDCVIGIKCECERERAELLATLVKSVLGKETAIERYCEEKEQILVYDKEFELSLAPAQYGYCKKGNKTVIGTGAFIGFETACRAYLESGSESEIFTAEERHFEKLPHTVQALDKKSDEMIKRVLDTENTDISKIKGTVYYVSETDGNDDNDGKSAKTPWKTLKKVEKSNFYHGDAVLFERDGLYRGSITATSGLTYGSYGEGEKPIICGSRMDYSKGDLWELISPENHIWRLTIPVIDPGIIIYNCHTRAVSCYEELTGERIIDEDEGAGYERLKKAKDLSFYWGRPELTVKTFNQYNEGHSLYIKSKKNPNTDYENIEIGEDGRIFRLGMGSDITVNNLCFKLTGGHAIGGSKLVKNLTVTDCVFCWIGGSLLWQTTRYGNAIEIFGACDGYVTKNNWIYEIYDTGITFQYHWKEGEAYFKDIDISDNIIERSYWLLEWWISPDVRGLPCHSENIIVENNFLKYGFKSWGTVQHGLHLDDDGQIVSWGAGIVAANLGDYAKNIIVKNNIFDRSFIDGHENVMTRHLNITTKGSAGEVKWIDNTFIQLDNQFFGRVSAEDSARFYTCERSQIDMALSKIPKESGTKICIIKTGN